MPPNSVIRWNLAENAAQEWQSPTANILEKKKYSYSRGETSLLEVLDAQRTANEVYQNYYEALFNANASLVELCRTVGIWDVDFQYAHRFMNCPAPLALDAQEVGRV
jgi:outer membrane protein TolC